MSHAQQQKPQTPMEYKRWRKQENKASLPQTVAPKVSVAVENNTHSFLSKFQTTNYGEEKTKEPATDNTLDWTTLSDNLSLLHHRNGIAKEPKEKPPKQTRTMETEQLTVPVDISLKTAMRLELQDNDKVLEYIRNEAEYLCFQHIFYSPCGQAEEWNKHILTLMETLKYVATIFIYPFQQDRMETGMEQQEKIIPNVATIGNQSSLVTSRTSYPVDNTMSEEYKQCKTWQLAFHSVYQQWRLGHNQSIYVVFEKFVIIFISFYSQEDDSYTFLAITENVPTRVKQALDKAAIEYEIKQTRNRNIQTGQDNVESQFKNQTILFQGHTQVHALYELIWNEMPHWKKLFLKNVPTIISDKEFLYCSMTSANIRHQVDKLNSEKQKIKIEIMGVLLPASLYKLYAQLVDTSLAHWNIHLETDTRTLGSNKTIPQHIQKQFLQQPLPYPTSEECFALIESIGKDNKQYYVSWK